LPLYNFGL
uniref:Cydiastatin-6 n=1 Tax=Cydia pomonella TaxID=82600 RepID=ALL6_CYDPO|nr:RecName: Full=Cydiastatin-6 [Cydia pomonella]